MITDSSPIQYHQICIRNSHLICFRNGFFLCICDDNHTRVECFLYDDTLDRCSHCLSPGRCLKKDSTEPNEFICLCPACHSGHQCQFNSESFTFTLDQLFYTDLTSAGKETTIQLLIMGSLVAFILSIPNNLFAFVTLNRKRCLRTGIGQYLLYMSVINQISLGFLATRLIHLAVKSIAMSSSSTGNGILCKLFHYLLISSSRTVYWLSSLIAIERLYMTLFLNGRWLKKPHIARRLIALSVVGVFVTGVYESLFITSFTDVYKKYGAMCVSAFPIYHRATWRIVHLLVSIFNSVLPFLINLCCTIAISVIVVKNRTNTCK